MQMFLLMGWV